MKGQVRLEAREGKAQEADLSGSRRCWVEQTPCMDGIRSCCSDWFCMRAAVQSKTLPRDKLTFIALTTLEDTGRFMLLMASLRKFLVVYPEILLLHVKSNMYIR